MPYPYMQAKEQMFDYKQMLFKQIDRVIQTSNPTEHSFFVMQLEKLLISYIKNDESADGELYKKLQKIKSDRKTEFENTDEKNRKDPVWTAVFNRETAGQKFEVLMLFIEKCGFLPERKVDLILE